MDLDRFKEINDTLGHHYGDLLLIELARRLESVLRRSDTVARLGGDEFGILVRAALGTRTSTSSRRSSASLAALEQPFQVDGLPLHVEASIGVARYPAHGHDVDLLLQRADVAMYVAKETGMPHAIYTAELDRPRHGEPDAALGAAARDRATASSCCTTSRSSTLEDGRAGRRRGARALAASDARPDRARRVRARRREDRADPAAHALRARRGARPGRALGAARGRRLDVAVNLSMRNLHDADAPRRRSRALLRKWELPGERLTVEITESAIVLGPGRPATVIGRLRSARRRHRRSTTSARATRRSPTSRGSRSRSSRSTARSC